MAVGFGGVSRLSDPYGDGDARLYIRSASRIRRRSIAAIDNVTRKLMQEGKRPVAVGLFFSLGPFDDRGGAFDRDRSHRQRSRPIGNFKSVGAVAGTLVSALFLFAIAIANILV